MFELSWLLTPLIRHLLNSFLLSFITPLTSTRFSSTTAASAVEASARKKKQFTHENLRESSFCFVLLNLLMTPCKSRKLCFVVPESFFKTLKLRVVNVSRSMVQRKLNFCCVSRRLKRENKSPLDVSGATINEKCT